MIRARADAASICCSSCFGSGKPLCRPGWFLVAPFDANPYVVAPSGELWTTPIGADNLELDMVRTGRTLRALLAYIQQPACCLPSNPGRSDEVREGGAVSLLGWKLAGVANGQERVWLKPRNIKVILKLSLPGELCYQAPGAAGALQGVVALGIFQWQCEWVACTWKNQVNGLFDCSFYQTFVSYSLSQQC